MATTPLPPPFPPAGAASTHIVVPDLRVVFSEHLQARGEALHEAAAAVVAQRRAPGGAGAAQQQQQPQDGAQGAGSHGGALLEEQGGAAGRRSRAEEQGGGARRSSEVHTWELILIFIYSRGVWEESYWTQLGDFFLSKSHSSVINPSSH